MGLAKYLNLFIYLFLYRLLCEFCLFCSTNGSVAIVSVNINYISIFNGINFKDWKENVLIILGYMDMDMDLTLRIDQPPPLTTDSSAETKKEFERWDHSNLMSLMIIKRDIP